MQEHDARAGQQVRQVQNGAVRFFPVRFFPVRFFRVRFFPVPAADGSGGQEGS